MTKENIEILNYLSNDLTYSPCIIIHGKVNNPNDKEITVTNVNTAVTNVFEINYGFFKATIELVPGSNPLIFTTNSNHILNFAINFTPLTSNKPIHLCLLVAKDSPLKYDTNDIKEANLSGETHLNLAIQKLQIAGRLAQAYTNEQMYRNGYSQRTMQFVEEFSTSKLYRQDPNLSKSNIKIHILRSSYTTKEILNPDIAQQNPNGKNRGKLFEIAIEEINKYDNGRLIKNYSSANPIQAAVIFMDTKYDSKNNMILGHAALGGGNDIVKLAIFGSHGLYCWPSYFEDLSAIMLNNNRVVDNGLPVSNDNGEAGTVFETFSTTLGAFIHEIGHSLTLPHRTYGVMLRDYIVLHRSFMSREVSGRGNNYANNKFISNRPFVPNDECPWHPLDLVRFRNHECFKTPSDVQLLNKCSTTCQLSRDRKYLQIQNKTGGIYAIEIQDLKTGDRLSKGWHIYQEPIRGLISLDIERDILKHANLDIQNTGIEIYGVNSSTITIDNLKTYIEDAFITIQGVQVSKSLLYGRKTNDIVCCLFPENNNTKINKIIIYHGGAIDGIGIFFTSGKPPVLLGNQTKDFTTFIIQDQEIGKLKIRTGQWVDAVQFFNKNNSPITKMVGNTTGGSEHVIEGDIRGLYSSTSKWMDGIGALY
ncbi:hypothetical protein ACO0R3_004017 [Hanseniaspora guilliermondii]